jgi:hypothetical protein
MGSTDIQINHFIFRIGYFFHLGFVLISLGDRFIENNHEVPYGELQVSAAFQEILTLFFGDVHVGGFTNRAWVYDPRY